MAAAELVEIPAFGEGIRHLSALRTTQKVDRTTQPAITPLASWMQKFEIGVHDPQVLYEEERQQHAAFEAQSTPLMPLLERASAAYAKRSDVLCRLFEYQCAVFQNTASYLRGAEDIRSVLDVKISRRDETPYGWKKKTLTDLDIVTLSTLPDGTTEIVIAETLSSGDPHFSPRHMNTVGKKPKPGEVKLVYDGAKLDSRIYRIPELAMHIDAYMVILPPHQHVSLEMMKHVDVITRPLVESYRPVRPDGIYARPAVSIVHSPTQWGHVTKRWHLGIPQQTPCELKMLVKRLTRYPVKGFVEERLTNAESYRGQSSPLFRPAYVSQ